MPRKSKSRLQGRNSVDGRFITKEEAKRRPSTTQIEHVPKPGFGTAGGRKKKGKG